MSFDDYERDGRTPVEVYRFSYGDSIWRYTSGDSEIIVAEETYAPSPLTRGRLEMNDEARTGTVDVRAPSSNPVVRLFAKSQPFLPVTVTIYRVHLDDPTLEPVKWFEGQVESCRFSPRTGTLHCVPMESIASRKLAVLSYQMTCNNELFDQRCQVDPTYFTYSYAVAEVSDPDPANGLGAGVLLESAAATFFTAELIDILAGGVATFGLEKRTITSHSGAQIYLIAPFDELLVGDTLELSAGCDKKVGTCRDRFNNLSRFQGFPYIPRRNPFEGAGLE